jgi:hypothetical protein
VDGRTPWKYLGRDPPQLLHPLPSRCRWPGFSWRQVARAQNPASLSRAQRVHLRTAKALLQPRWQHARVRDIADHVTQSGGYGTRRTQTCHCPGVQPEREGSTRALCTFGQEAHGDEKGASAIGTHHAKDSNAATKHRTRPTDDFRRDWDESTEFLQLLNELQLPHEAIRGITRGLDFISGALTNTTNSHMEWQAVIEGPLCETPEGGTISQKLAGQGPG